MTRKHPFKPADLDGDRLALYRSITEGPRAQGPRLFDLVSDDGVLLGPFNEFLLRPALGDALQRVGAAVRYAGSLGGRAREMAILVVAAHWDSAFERHAHEPIGEAAGLTGEEIAELRDRAASFTDPAEQAAYDVVRALLQTGGLDDAAYAAAAGQLAEAEIFELTTLVGYYGTLAQVMRVFGVGAP